LRGVPIRPGGARFDPELSEFVFPYDAMRAADDPDAGLMDFLQSTYEAGATRGGWNRSELERA